ncbi:MAG: tRNA (N6-isopentenyl adenosine(37)-C2)-methylthiotransferase MiaB [Lentisphaerae bacterium]|nr:tRNA (N6-isopentenyl adenosine(37)-C2)-methylthiotransferase MiaB [Lentisphaerota bacterium]
MKFFIKTYGCQMNVRDSQAVAALLLDRGYIEADREDAADLILVNTCSVRGKAEDKALGKLGLLTARKDGVNRLVGAMGCMVQRLGAGLFERVPGLDFAVGTRQLTTLPNIIESALAGRTHLLAIGESDDPDDLSGHSEPGPSAYVNVLYGCDRCCAYCIVPFVRGREWSRSPDRILDEIKDVVDKGFKEVILLGQSVMSYGMRNNVWQFAPVSAYTEPFPRLLEVVNRVELLERIRFTSGHPSGCTQELARAMRQLGAVCEHIHLPVQSGSDRILKLMHRGYTVDEYRRAVDVLRNSVPDVAITTDIIVGFPSETEKEFEMTGRFMEEIGFDNAFIFKYSPRPGTLAFKMEDSVPEDEKMKRNKILLEEQNKRCHAINKSYIGKKVEVLAEGASRRNPLNWTGRTRNNKIVIFEPEPAIRVGSIVTINIERAMQQTLYGTVL